MEKEEELFKNRIRDLAKRSYNNNLFTFTDFMGLAESSLYYQLENELRYAAPDIWGINEDCERILLRFGDANAFGYEEDFPISILRIKPLIDKFSDELTHRDVLGSLMNLGIERPVLGDIKLSGNIAYVYCLSSISQYICDNITRIKHTSVMCEIVPEIPDIDKPQPVTSTIQISSARIDAVIAKVYNISRSKCIPLFVSGKVFVNGKLCENNSYTIKDSDIITVRGIGRFTYVGATGLSRKGKINATIVSFASR